MNGAEVVFSEDGTIAGPHGARLHAGEGALVGQRLAALDGGAADDASIIFVWTPEFAAAELSWAQRKASTFSRFLMKTFLR